VFHLPGAVHLVAQTPELDRVRLVIAMFTPEVGVVAARRVVAIFDEIARCVAIACAEVDGKHGLDGGGATPIDELVGAERVRLG
jgi:hypothetical protein